ncbi:type III-B CRISPR module RAMP protein Cmr6 [Moraxella catarrhalis]|uniref:type III-B CRISPR module RAMP protein Cmr6 n=1 Tax=Moraxella catarrhalis TaxID=480 RepID=UPI00128D9D35|nr:type III-B CRISPR module RAMP protein Cmr6 [Moraxella catarrhalis]MPX18886.1 type III-B CRISPR module RAMP protein Cmr6 [Moraxella catarrhalis]
MTIALMRKRLCDVTKKLDSAHAGLLMQRGLQVWEEGEKSIKQNLIFDISSIKANPLYILAFRRWFAATYDQANFATVSAKTDGRLFTGLPLGGTLETGTLVHHSYGMPMIAGSGIKGAVRNYTEHLFAKRDSDGQVCYHDGKVVVQADKQPLVDVLFGVDGDDADAGYLVWHDAWWIPKINHDGTLVSNNNENQPFVSEIITVHHQKYYDGSLLQALDTENPVPNHQIATQGSFYFTIEGEQTWLMQFAQTLLENMLIEQGLGAKGSNGYGYFTIGSDHIKPYVQELDQQKQQAISALQDEKLKQATKNLNDNQTLIYTFSHKLNNLDEQWQKNVNHAHHIEIDGEKYWFDTLFKLVESWNDEDKGYAVCELFAKHQKHLSKKMQAKIKELKKELGA